jgi:AraC-like DNA-binding protein
MFSSKITRLTPIDMQAVDAAIAYIFKRSPVNISADQLAVEVGLPKEKLQAGIKKKTKKSLHEYIVHIRIEKSKDLLRGTNHPLKTIAKNTGFSDKSHYCKVFRRLEGVSPTEFRLSLVLLTTDLTPTALEFTPRRELSCL